jgi:hypothetical protein
MNNAPNTSALNGHVASFATSSIDFFFFFYCFKEMVGYLFIIIIIIILTMHLIHLH